jgi:chitodextrinase
MDFDGDCRSDILWRNAATGSDVIYFMNGLSIVSAPTVDTVTDQAWQIQGIGDFDGDGKADILWRNALTGDDFIYLMSGAKPVAQSYLDTVVGNAWQIQGVGDFDGDGKADLLWRNTATGDNFIYLMNGTTIKSPVFLNTVSDQAWQVKGIGDFDGDGKADIFWRNSATGENYIYLMNGATIAARGTLNFVTDMAWQVKGVGDFDGDGKADILWRNSVTGDVYVYLMNGLKSATLNCCGYVTTIADQNWQVKAIGDFDGDGRADIFWRNGATGDDFVFLMNGVAIAAQAHVNTQADQYWMPKSSTTLADTTGPDKMPPTIPPGLSAGAVSSSRIDLSWRASTDNVGVTRYRVYRDGAQIATVSGTSYSNTGLQPMTTYSYAVAAADAAGNLSAQSTAASATTKPLPDTQPPSVPANLAARVVSNSQIDLSWSASTDNVGVIGYRVFRDGALAASPAGTLVSITGLTAGTTYSFAVAAFDASGNASALSAPLSATTALVDTIPPTVPNGLVASALTPTSLTLSWNPSTDNVAVTGYRVYRDSVLVASLAGTSVPVAGLVAGTLYSLTVAAFDAAGNVSPMSAPLAVTTLSATAPQILWRAGMETGNLSEWSEKVNSGAADSWAVTAASEGIPPKGGSWVMKQSVTGSYGGTRMQRYPEINSLTPNGTTFYVSWWDYYPAKLTAAGPGFMFANFEIASQDNCAACYNPIWGLFVNPADFTLVLGWSPNGLAPAEGPHAGESGKRGYTSTTPIPVGQWVFFEVMITPSSTFTGAVKIWMDGQVLFDLANVKTRYPSVGVGGMMWTAHTGYGSSISPTPATHYIDDVTISLGRLPYAP